MFCSLFCRPQINDLTNENDKLKATVERRDSEIEAANCDADRQKLSDKATDPAGRKEVKVDWSDELDKCDEMVDELKLRDATIADMIEQIMALEAHVVDLNADSEGIQEHSTIVGLRQANSANLLNTVIGRLVELAST